jgi:anti-sigma B factor antagonist
MPTCDFLMVQAYDQIVVAKVMKERLLDAGHITAFGAGLIELLDRYPKVSLIIDLSEVQYLSSAVLGKLVAIHKKTKELKGRMAIAGALGPVLPLFKVTGLDKVLTFFPEAGVGVSTWKRTPL